MGAESPIVLDTNVLIWLDQRPTELGKVALRQARAGLQAGLVAVCVISFWEVGLLVAKRRFRQPTALPHWRRSFRGAGVVEMGIDGEVAIAAAILPFFQPDPADRMIVAASIVSGTTLMTADAGILSWAGPLIRLAARR